MHKKNYLFVCLIPLLAACSSYTGVINQRYDGAVIETDAAALTAYAETQTIIKAEKEMLGQAIPDFFYDAPLGFVDEEYIRPLTHEPVTVGIDMPEGRYTIAKSDEMGTGYLTVLDADGTKVYEQLLDYTQSTLELNLYEGMKIKANEGYSPRLIVYGKTVDPFGGANMFGEAPPPAEDGQKRLGNGVYHIGEHLEPGEYALEVAVNFSTSGVNYVYLLNADGSFKVFELTADYRDWVDNSIPVTLTEGQTLFIASKATTLLTPAE